VDRQRPRRTRSELEHALTPPARITAYPDGPYLVRGEFELLDAKGRAIERRRRTIALCRCGRSRIQPFCDGTHAVTGFEADDRAVSPED